MSFADEAIRAARNTTGTTKADDEGAETVVHLIETAVAESRDQPSTILRAIRKAERGAIELLDKVPASSAAKETLAASSRAAAAVRCEIRAARV